MSEPVKMWVADPVSIGQERTIHGRPHIVTAISRSACGVEATLEEKAGWLERTSAAPVGFRASLGRHAIETQPSDSVADILGAVRRMLLGGSG